MTSEKFIMSKQFLYLQYPSNFTLIEDKDSKYDPDKDLFINSSKFFLFTIMPVDNTLSLTPKEYSENNIHDLINNDDRPDMYRILIDDPKEIELDGESVYKFNISNANREIDKSEIVQNVFYTDRRC